MKTSEGHLEHETISIWYTWNWPERQPKAIIILVHGFGEHSGRYQEGLIPFFVAQGWAVLAYDQVGHGRSGGKRGHCKSYEQLHALLEKIIQMGLAEFSEVPLLLYGHSMGGNLALNYGIKYPKNITAIIASSPYLRLAFQPPAWKMVLGKMFYYLLPSLTMPSGLDPAGISRIPEEVERYRNDALVHDKVSPMFSFPIMEAGEWAIHHAAELKIPTLILHGTADPIIAYNGSSDFHENSEVTTLVTFEGGYHELHHDLEQEKLKITVKDWISKFALP